MKLKGMLAEAHAFHGRHCGGMPVNDQFIAAPCPPDDGVLMTCVGGNALSCGNGKDADPYGHEQHGVIPLAELLVHLAQDIGRIVSHHGLVLDQRLGDHHEQGRGHSFAGYIRNDHAQMVLIDQEEIIKITADLPGRMHERVKVKFTPVRKRGENPGQHIRLDLGGNIELSADLFLFGRNTEQIGHIAARIVEHGIESVRQHLHFISRMDIRPFIVDPGRILSLPAAFHKAGGNFLQLFQRSDHAFAEPLIHAEQEECDQDQDLRAHNHPVALPDPGDFLHAQVRGQDRDRLSRGIQDRYHSCIHIAELLGFIPVKADFTGNGTGVHIVADDFGRIIIPGQPAQFDRIIIIILFRFRPGDTGHDIHHVVGLIQIHRLHNINILDVIVFLDPVEEILGPLILFRLAFLPDAAFQVVSVDLCHGQLQYVMEISLVPAHDPVIIGQKSDRTHDQGQQRYEDCAADQETSAQGVSIILHVSYLSNSS